MRALITTLAALAGIFGLSACGVVRPTVAASTTQEVVIDQSIFTTKIDGATGAPVLPRDQAIAIAAGRVPTASQATRVSAQYVLLTIRNANDQIALGVKSHPVWLVTFSGAAYNPLSTPETTCPCGSYYQRPNTVVALDAQSGTLIVTYGVG